MNLTLPELSLGVLIGPSAAGKSTFARTHFKETEILSSDYCRALAADDENDLAATDDAFAILHFTVAFTVAYLLTGSLLIGGAMALVEPLINTVAFYFHEKWWTWKTSKQTTSSFAGSAMNSAVL